MGAPLAASSFGDERLPSIDPNFCLLAPGACNTVGTPLSYPAIDPYFAGDNVNTYQGIFSAFWPFDEGGEAPKQPAPQSAFSDSTLLVILVAVIAAAVVLPGIAKRVR